MLLAALVEEQRQAEASLKQTEARMAVAAASTDTGLWQYDVPSGYLWATEHCRSMFGLAADSPLNPKASLAPFILTIARWRSSTSRARSASLWPGAFHLVFSITRARFG
jgi:hypothetical protein